MLNKKSLVQFSFVVIVLNGVPHLFYSKVSTYLALIYTRWRFRQGRIQKFFSGGVLKFVLFGKDNLGGF